MIKYHIRTDDLTGQAVRELLVYHLREMMKNSPAESVFALDISGLQQPEVIVWSAWDEANLAGVGALRELEDGCSGELKSMRTSPDYLRQGVGAALLEHAINYARSKGYKQVLLETGSGEAFEAALGLYRQRGFVAGGAFADYEKSEFNQFLHLTL